MTDTITEPEVEETESDDVEETEAQRLRDGDDSGPRDLPNPRERYVDFANWLAEVKGYTVDPAQAQVAINRYGEFQKSDYNREKNAERVARNKAEKAEKSAGYAERRRLAAIRKEEQSRTAIEKAEARLAKAKEEAERNAVLAAGGTVPPKVRKPRKSKQTAQEAVAAADDATGEVTFASDGTKRESVDAAF